MGRKKTILLLVLGIIFSNISFCQEKPKNIILLIGDGMGLAQVYAAYQKNNENLFIYSMPHVALSITTCADRKVTDSGAGGTAISTGKKTYYHAIGVNKDTIPQKTLLEYAKQKGKKTAILVSCDLTHATPACFISHVKDRDMQEDIAKYYLTENCDILLGGGLKRFTPNTRKDKENLIDSLKERGYEIVYNEKELNQAKSDKIAGFFADEHLPLVKDRGDIEQKFLDKTLEAFSKDTNGFFIMLEGSQIDMQAHDNHYDEMVEETLDFDACVRKAVEFAKKDGNTLVIVTADHETGGLTLPAKDNTFKPKYSTFGHTGVPIIIYSYGVGSEEFEGVMQNNETGEKLFDLIK
jgi:alkaline phosphatase